MVIVVEPVWNLHFTIQMLAIGVPCAMPPKVLGYGRGVMGPINQFSTEIWTDLHWYQILWAAYMFEEG